jgi:hypothetical protein
LEAAGVRAPSLLFRRISALKAVSAADGSSPAVAGIAESLATFAAAVDCAALASVVLPESSLWLPRAIDRSGEDDAGDAGGFKGFSVSDIASRSFRPSSLSVPIAGREVRLQADFISSAEYKAAYSSYEEFRELDHPPLTVVDGGETAVSSRDELLRHILDQGKKGLSIQRYKGLGEMNAEQLWESTMDPASRILLQVRLEDEEVAENIFTTLMGDAVEPRRQFIEENALNVRNLDI